MNPRHIARPAKAIDNVSRIASLIYATDPYIYPFWFGSESQAIEPLSRLIQIPSTIFSLDNVYVMEDLGRAEIVGIIIAIGAQSKLEYDYSELKMINRQYRFTIDHYIEPTVCHVQGFDADTVELVNCCVAPEARGYGLGKIMLGDFMKLATRRGFRRFKLDCLADNAPALALYHGAGFQDVGLGIGFDGTDHSQVATMSLICEL